MTIPETHQAEARAWRHDFHRHPELGFKESRTSAIIAQLLESWGLRVPRGITGTGVIGTLGDGSGPSIGIRAVIDALPIAGKSALPYALATPGVMHACGHDGHTAALLLTARLAAEARARGGIRRTVHFIFRTAEENDGGAKVLIEEGLLDRALAIRSLRCTTGRGWPRGRWGRPLRYGASRCAGRGGHAAMPYLSAGVISAALGLGLALHKFRRGASTRWIRRF
jgi:amidohydrolase